MENSDLRFVALLRGINVGGKNLISKQELLRCFEDLGFTNVRTYIQSGNILFRSTNKNPEQLTTTIEEGLSVRFSYAARVALLSHDQYKEAVASAPASWGKDDRQLHNALFTLGEITPREFLAHLPPPKQQIETVTLGQRVVFWSVSKEHLSKATIMKLSKEPVYQEVTVRNHNTALKLLALFEEI